MGGDDSGMLLLAIGYASTKNSYHFLYQPTSLYQNASSLFSTEAKRILKCVTTATILKQPLLPLKLGFQFSQLTSPWCILQSRPADHAVSACSRLRCSFFLYLFHSRALACTASSSKVSFVSEFSEDQSRAFRVPEETQSSEDGRTEGGSMQGHPPFQDLSDVGDFPGGLHNLLRVR